MLSRWLRFAAATTVGVALASPFVVAHDLPTNTVMNAFVKIEPEQAHLVVRVPLDLLRGASFPMKGPQYDLAAAGPAMQAALKGLADGLPLWENGQRLMPSSSNGRLSLPSDRSFEDYDRALESANRSTDPTIAIYYAQGFVDAHSILPPAGPHFCDHRFHPRAFDHVDRCGVSSGAARSMVSAVRRNRDCSIDRLHGLGEHRGCGPAPPLAYHRDVRTRTRLRLFLRPRAAVAVRRLAPAGVAVLVQPRH